MLILVDLTKIEIERILLFFLPGIEKGKGRERERERECVGISPSSQFFCLFPNKILQLTARKKGFSH